MSVTVHSLFELQIFLLRKQAYRIRTQYQLPTKIAKLQELACRQFSCSYLKQGIVLKLKFKPIKAWRELAYRALRKKKHQAEDE